MTAAATTGVSWRLPARWRESLAAITHPAGRPSPAGDSGRAAARRLAGIVAAVACLGAAPASGLLPGGIALAVAAGVRAVEIQPPPGAAANPSAVLLAVSCPAPGRCAAAGRYFDAAIFGRAMGTIQARGRWQRAVQLRMPADAAANPNAAVNALACTPAGSCTAVGVYSPQSGTRPFATTESAGRWRRATAITLPPGAAAPANADLLGLSCPRSGSCTATGFYADVAGHIQIMAVTESNGRWAAARRIAPPSNAAPNPEQQLTSVSCPAPGSCVAVGDYRDRDGHFQAMVAAEAGGRWRRAAEARLPSDAATNPDATLSSVTCTGAGTCVAVGTYTEKSGQSEAMAATEANARWRTPAEIISPPDAAPNPFAALDSVSCVKPGYCTTVGSYFPTAHHVAMLANEIRGRWQRARRAPLPPSAATGPGQFSVLFSVACRTGGSCVSVGTYVDTSGNQQATSVTTPLP